MSEIFDVGLFLQDQMAVSSGFLFISPIMFISVCTAVLRVKCRVNYVEYNNYLEAAWEDILDIIDWVKSHKKMTFRMVVSTRFQMMIWMSEYLKLSPELC